MADHIYTVAHDGETSTEKNSKLMPTEIAIGIDIGTSKCSVAVWNGSQVELLRNTRNQKLNRSYVLLKDEVPSGGVSTKIPHGDPEILSGCAVFNMKRLIGRIDTDPVVHASNTLPFMVQTLGIGVRSFISALENNLWRSITPEEILSGCAVFNMKRLIGRIDTDPVVHASKTLPFMVQTLGIGVRPFIAALENNVWRSTTPEEIFAFFLLELKAMAELQLKRPIRNAVLTVPVSFSRFQLTRIERACAMAGINVIRMMPEPTAVALLYAQQQQQQTMHNDFENRIKKYALIFSMGAGYCDVAITATARGVSQILALRGIPLGGEDILQNILRYLLPYFESFCSNHSSERIKSMALLRIAAENAIHELSSQTSVEINVDLGNGNKISRSLTRAEFEEVNHGVFVKCENLAAQCMLDAWLLRRNLTDVILVGGCSSIPKIRSLVLGFCTKGELYKGIDPLEAAVHGAAMEGAIASGITDPSGSLNLLTIQATPLSLGIRVDGDGFAPIIRRNTAVPSRKEMLFTTARNNQTEALIVVYEGESEKAEENNILGYFKISGIPLAPKGSAEICVCMDIDASNILRVYAGAFLLGTRQAVSPFLEVRMPTIDDGHGWCGQALVRMYGTTMDLDTIPKKVQR